MSLTAFSAGPAAMIGQTRATNLLVERAAARSYDLVIVNDHYHGIQWLELGARRMETLPMSACDPEFHHTFELTAAEREQYACDVGFVGTLIPNHLYSERIAALEALRDFDLGIWSVHEVPPALRPYYRGPALGEQMLRVTGAARLTVNTHGDFMRYGGNMRLFEACGVGTFQIADDRPGVAQWFTPGEHLVTYRAICTTRHANRGKTSGPRPASISSSRCWTRSAPRKHWAFTRPICPKRGSSSRRAAAWRRC